MIMSKGYNKLVIQTGLGTYIPTLANDEQLQSEVYQFKESLQGDMEEASLIISHGGEFNCPILVGVLLKYAHAKRLFRKTILVVPHQLGILSIAHLIFIWENITINNFHKFILSLHIS